MNKSNEIYRSRIDQVIDHVASVAFFSPFHFHRIFVAVTGETNNISESRPAITERMEKFKTARFAKNYIL